MPKVTTTSNKQQQTEKEVKQTNSNKQQQTATNSNKQSKKTEILSPSLCFMFSFHDPSNLISFTQDCIDSFFIQSMLILFFICLFATWWWTCPVLLPSASASPTYWGLSWLPPYHWSFLLYFTTLLAFWSKQKENIYVLYIPSSLNMFTTEYHLYIIAHQYRFRGFSSGLHYSQNYK